MKKMQIRKPLSPAAGILALTILISFGGCASNPGNEQKAEHTESSVTTGAAQQSGSGDLSSPEKSAGTAESTNDDSVSSNTNAVDMTVRDENPEYGVIYYTPSDVKHIAKSDDSSIEYVDNEILIVANENAARDDIAGLAEKYNAEIVGEIEVTGDYQLKLNKTCTMKGLDKLADELESDALVDRAYPNYVTGMSSESVTSSPPDGLNYGDAWRKDIQKYDGKGLSWGWEAIHTNEAWEYLSENEDKVNKDLRLGLIDSGFYLDWDLEFAATFYDNGNNGENQTNEEREHGTHVAGTMAAISDNERGICGVYPYGKGNLYGVRFPSYGDNVRNSENEKLIIADKIALAELIIRNVKVINISMGYIDENIVKIELKDELHTSDAFIEFCCVIMPDIIGDYLQRFIDKGYDFVIVNASGNTSNSKEYDKKIIVNDKNIETNWIKTKYTSEICGIDKEKYPDVYNRIIVVGSVNEKLELSRFCNIGERVDVYAPGENIYSIIPQQKYGKNQGTSMASPHVAGVAAMVWAANSSLTGAEVKSIVCVSGIYARDYGFTFGIPKQLNPDSSNQRAYFVNAAAAVNMALNSLGSRRKT